MTGNTGGKSETGSMFYRLLFFAALCLVIYVRLRLASAPLERDEGEFAYGGWLALQGFPPYSMMYNMKFPGIYWVYALVMSVFGQTDTGLRAGLLVINIMSSYLVYSCVRKLFNEKAGLAAAACFLIMGFSRGLTGVFFGAEHVVVLFSLAGARLLISGFEKDSKPLFFASGLMLGLAFVTRQHGAYFILASLAYIFLMYRGRAARAAVKISVFLSGAAVPAAAAAAYLFSAGVMKNFIFWVFIYGMKYVSSVSLNHAAILFYSYFSVIFFFLWPLMALALAGALSGFFSEKRPETALVLLWLAAASAAVSAGFYFRPHYFIYLMPPLAALCGAAVFALEGMPASGLKKAALKLELMNVNIINAKEQLSARLSRRLNA